MITQIQLKDVLLYDSKNGLFYWKISPSTHIKIGTIAGRTSNKGYRQITIKGRQYSSHRLAWLYVYGSFPKGCIDHINGIRTDNRIDNLRDVDEQTNLQNLRKSRKNNKTGYLGVCWDKQQNSYKAAVKKNGKSFHLGYFDDPKIAHEAYIQAKRKIHEGCTI